MDRNWFEWYCNQTYKEKKWMEYRGRFLCPCCYMPTLEERNGYDICPICSWEDDGQDSDDADIVRGGPNGSYSLQEARSNFEKLQTMYRKEDTSAFEMECKSKEKRMNIYDVFSKAIITKSDLDWETALKVECKYRKR